MRFHPISIRLGPDQLQAQLRKATEQATAARVELGTLTGQLDSERAGRQADRQTAQARLTEAREQARADADQRVAELRITYEERLAEVRDRAERDLEQLRRELAALGDNPPDPKEIRRR